MVSINHNNLYRYYFMSGSFINFNPKQLNWLTGLNLSKKVCGSNLEWVLSV